jgi:hypothetical protein
MPKGPRPFAFHECYTVEPRTGCWLWTKYLGATGYGRIRNDGQRYGAHRYSWEIHRGEIPAGMCVLHKCDTRPCVNPDHLFLGTKTDNANDRTQKGRGRGQPGESHYMAKLTEADVAAIRSDPRLQRIIAKDYGVTQPAISLIKRQARWKCAGPSRCPPD